MKRCQRPDRAHGGFSTPSKMPCYGWSIPATLCKVGTKLRSVEGSVCSQCYAMKGMYRFPTVMSALARRYGKLMDTLIYPSVRAEYVAHFTEDLEGEKYFRWFDSGDLQCVEHLELIIEIVEATPWCKHWLPTKEKGIVHLFLRQGGELPSNLCLRVSAAMIGHRNQVNQFLYDDGVRACSVNVRKEYAKQCHAYKRGGHCGKCRACWNKEILDVSYPLH